MPQFTIASRVRAQAGSDRPCCGIHDTRIMFPASCPLCRLSGADAAAERQEFRLSLPRMPLQRLPPLAEDRCVVQFLGFAATWIAVGGVFLAIFPQMVASWSVSVACTSAVTADLLTDFATFHFLRRHHRRAARQGAVLCPECLHSLRPRGPGVVTCPECGASGILADIEESWSRLRWVGGRFVRSRRNQPQRALNRSWSA